MTLVFATHNKNKLKEIQSLLPESIQIKSLTDIGCHEEIIEDADTIAGNALIKSQYVKKHYGYDCFADDTGLEVEALNGAPGVYSARYAGEHGNATANMDKLLQELDNNPNRSAKFKTVISLILDGNIYAFEGICKGEITTTKQGEAGFGYDPIFKPEGLNSTFAQLTLQEKGQISHRGKAVAQLINFLQQ